MSEAAETRKKSWRVFGLASLLLMVIPVLTCGGVLTWFFGRQIVAARQVAERIEDLKSQGEPVDDDSMQQLYQSRTSGALTDAWLAVSEKLRSDEFSEACKVLPIFSDVDINNQPISIPPPGEPWNDRDAVDEFFAIWDPVAQDLIDLSEGQMDENTKPVRRPIKFQSVSTILAETQETRSMARLLALKHAVAVYDGDQAAGYECLRAIRGLERSLDAEPFIVSFLIKVAINHVGNEMLENSLCHDQLNDAQMEQCAKDIRGYDHLREAVRYAMRGERGMMLPVFRDEKLAESAMGEQGGVGSGLLSKLRSKDALLYMELMQEAIALPEDMKGFCEAAQEMTERFASESQESGPIGNLDRGMTEMLFGAVEVYANATIRIAEENRLARLSIATRRFEKKNGQFPDALHELSDYEDVSKLVPMSNRAFGYRTEENGDAVIWGIKRFPNNDIDAVVPTEPYVDQDVDQPGLVWRLNL